MKLVRMLAIAPFLIALGAPAQTAPSAEQVLAEAKTRAAAEHKTIFVHFGASWCGWCRRMDKFLETPEIRAAFEIHFVPVKLVVGEKEEKRNLNNAGAEVILEKVGGTNAGLPFSAFLDAKGELIVNSKRIMSS